MFVTRPLSLFKTSPEAVSELLPEGPNSGYLVTTDEEWENEARSCGGLFKDKRIKDFPFPQNRILTVEYSEYHGQHWMFYHDKVLFVPVIGQPLSANMYYVIMAQGKYKGQACSCSKEEDKSTYCFCNHIRDIKPRPLDFSNIYQQVLIKRCGKAQFVASSIASDGYAPRFLRRKGWRVYASSSQQIPLHDVNGVDIAVRNPHPSSDFPISNTRSMSVVMGGWHCPFMFIKEEDTTVKGQMERSPFYEMTLERFWEQIFACENSYSGQENVVAINTSVKMEVVRLFGEEEVRTEDIRVGDGWVWFRIQKSGAKRNVGLSLPMLESMRVEAKRGDWVEREEREVRIERVDEFKGDGGWSRYGSYVLVDRFVLKRMDGSLVLICDFRHTHQLQAKWE
ncbi:hypothetical protein H6P81_008648 [Aristolochia fimbriata]|uniref:Uncharacterized protein n=1 Tax=Aristolochia fimbriata TaxID=158543 RepID=A0AAV7EN76_ARIFI|nr:hypothetical protein H6P81_008648 [Aristolochia fimbriata]